MLLAILACWATFAGGPPALVNTDADGERVPLGPATAWAADAEATRVAFVTPARALPDLDANDVDDVYVKDLATGELVLASRGADGTAAGAPTRSRSAATGATWSSTRGRRTWDPASRTTGA